MEVKSLKSEKPLFSIVVPIYNVEKYLEDCVNSILNQTFTDYELILVDDGSTDSSPDICNMYGKCDDRIKVIHKKNGGLVSARKAGIEIANGRYVVSVDGDDWLEFNHLLELSKIIEKYMPDIVCFSLNVVEDGNRLKHRSQFRTGLYNKNDIVKEIYPQLIQTARGLYFSPSLCTKIIKMDIYRSVQLCVDDRIKIGEDGACTMPCIVRAASMYILDTPLYNYRQNNMSMTKNKKTFSWDGPELIDVHLRKMIENTECDMQEQISRRTVHALINVVKTQFYRHERYRDIVRNIKTELERPTYKNAINNSRFFMTSPMFFFHLYLKHKILYPLYFLSKIR